MEREISLKVDQVVFELWNVLAIAMKTYLLARRGWTPEIVINRIGVEHRPTLLVLAFTGDDVKLGMQIPKELWEVVKSTPIPPAENGAP